MAPPEASHDSQDDPSGIYVKQIGGGPPVRLTRGTSVLSVIIVDNSPDS